MPLELPSGLSIRPPTSEKNTAFNAPADNFTAKRKMAPNGLRNPRGSGIVAGRHACAKCNKTGHRGSATGGARLLGPETASGAAPSVPHHGHPVSDRNPLTTAQFHRP